MYLYRYVMYTYIIEMQTVTCGSSPSNSCVPKLVRTPLLKKSPTMEPEKRIAA